MSNIFILLYVAATSLALILLKLGTANGSPITFENSKIAFNIGWYILGGILLYGLSFLIYTFLVSKYELGYIVPLVTGFVYVVICIASYFIFKESFTPLKILGILLILGGVFILNINK